MDLKFHKKTFDELTVHELYAILAFRSSIFVVEQQCIYQDLDYKDQCSTHLMVWKGKNLIAYSRIYSDPGPYPAVHIGRVIVRKLNRTKGLGLKLTALSVLECYKRYGSTEIRLSAQVHALNIYKRAGFRRCGNVYLEDGIEHVEMVRKSGEDFQTLIQELEAAVDEPLEFWIGEKAI